MAAPGRHVGTGARRVAAAGGGKQEAKEETEEDAEEETEEETEEEAEEKEAGALRSVFPRDPALFGDAFPVQRRYRLCGRVLRIAQHHGPRLGPAGAVWEAALSLCRFLGEQRFDFRGRTVIELGAGTGIVGILAALLGGDVTITDQPAALDQIQENVRLNFPAAAAAPQVRALVWGRDEGAFPAGYGVILGSDIVYHPPSFAPLLRTLRHLCGPRSIALLSAKMRGGGDGDPRRFFHQMLPPHFHIQLLQREPEEEIEIYGVTCRTDGGGGGGTPGFGVPQVGGP